MTSRRGFLGALTAGLGLGAVARKAEAEPLTGEWAEAIHAGDIGQPGRLNTSDFIQMERPVTAMHTFQDKLYIGTDDGALWELTGSLNDGNASLTLVHRS